MPQPEVLYKDRDILKGMEYLRRLEAAARETRVKQCSAVGDFDDLSRSERQGPCYQYKAILGWHRPEDQRKRGWSGGGGEGKYRTSPDVN